jgi:hypothetical protein
MTSFGFPWWVYIISIIRLWLKGYSLHIFAFKRSIIVNEDPRILSNTVIEVVEKMHSLRIKHDGMGVEDVGAIGNSLGAYMVFNNCSRHSLDNVILNGGGSISDMLFKPLRPIFEKVRKAYVSKGYDKKYVDSLWADIDDPAKGEETLALNILLQRSTQDDTIIPTSTTKFIEAFKRSSANLILEENTKSHIGSVFVNSTRVKRIDKFLSKQE